MKRKIDIYGFVIMPNHFHLLLTGEEHRIISQFMGLVKQYSARQIIDWCISNNENDVLNLFSQAAKQSKQGHNYQVWQKRFHSLVIPEYEDFLIKLNYIHNNPLQDRWKLCDKPSDYRFSSARYYLLEQEVGIPIIELI